MDLFNYTLKIQELDRAKYKKQYDAIMREMFTKAQEIYSHTYYSNYMYTRITEENFDQYKLIYKVYAKAINGINDLNTTAGFLIGGFNNLETNIVTYIADHGDYNTYLDTFEHSIDIQCTIGTVTDIFEKYVRIIDDNPYPYKIVFNTHTSGNYTNIAYGIKPIPTFKTKYISTKADIRLLIELEDFKSILDPSKTYTLLEEALDEIYSAKSNDNNSVITTIDTYKISAQRIVDAISVIQERIDGQLPVQTSAA